MDGNYDVSRGSRDGRTTYTCTVIRTRESVVDALIQTANEWGFDCVVTERVVVVKEASKEA